MKRSRSAQAGVFFGRFAVTSKASWPAAVGGSENRSNPPPFPVRIEGNPGPVLRLSRIELPGRIARQSERRRRVRGSMIQMFEAFPAVTKDTAARFLSGLNLSGLGTPTQTLADHAASCPAIAIRATSALLADDSSDLLGLYRSTFPLPRPRMHEHVPRREVSRPSPHRNDAPVIRPAPASSFRATEMTSTKRDRWPAEYTAFDSTVPSDIDCAPPVIRCGGRTDSSVD